MAKGRLGRLYVGLNTDTTLYDMGVVRWSEAVREEAVTTDPDTFGRTAPILYESSVTVTFLQNDDSALNQILDNPATLYNIFISPSPNKYGSTVDWYTALGDTEGYTLADVYPNIEASVNLGGEETTINITFSKRRKTTLVSDGVYRQSEFLHDFSILANHRDQKAVLEPLKGRFGSFTRSTTAPYFDEYGNYKIANANELIWSKSPSGRVLPTIYPSYTNEFTDNTTPTYLQLYETTLGTRYDWNGFGINDIMTTTNYSSHYIYLVYDPNYTPNTPVCMTALVKPLQGQTDVQFRVNALGTDGSSTGGTTFHIYLDGSGYTTSDVRYTPYDICTAGAEYRSGGYYFVWLSISHPDSKTNRLYGYFYPTDGTNEYYYTGDGTTPVWQFGAFCYYKNMIYPPAPVLTSGSAVTVSQDQLTFPFDVPFPEEGLTFAIEFDSGIGVSNLASGMPSYSIGTANWYTFQNNEYVPLWTYVYYGGYKMRPVGDIIGLANNKNVYRIATQLRNGLYIFSDVDTGEVVDNTNIVDGYNLTGFTANPAEIRFWVDHYTPIWIKRYAIARGIIDPKALI